MTSAEVGIYIRLICYAWLAQGLPNDTDELATMVGESRSAFEKAWKRVSRCFDFVSDRLVQPRLERVREEQDEYRSRMAERSRLGVEAKRRRARESGQPQVESEVQPKVDLKSTPAPAPANTSLLRKAAVTATNTGNEKPAVPYEKLAFPSHLAASLPEDVSDLAIVAIDFLAAFGNVTKPEARQRHSADYVGALAAFRGRGCSAAEAWSAFGDARIANNGRPLFGAEAKKAISFAPSRPSLRVVGPVDSGRGPYAGVPQTIAAEDRR